MNLSWSCRETCAHPGWRSPIIFFVSLLLGELVNAAPARAAGQGLDYVSRIGSNTVAAGVLIAIGAVVIFLSAIKYGTISAKLRDMASQGQRHYSRIYGWLRFLLLLFCAGYLVALYSLFFHSQVINQLMMAMVFFLGALFTLLVVLLQQRSLDEISRRYRMEMRINRDLQRKQRRLRESEERLRNIIDSVQAGLVIIDADNCTVQDANPAALDMLGASREDLVGSKCRQKICTLCRDTAPGDACGGPPPPEELAQRPKTSEHELRTFSGGSLPVQETVAPVELDGRRHYLVSFLDNSERKAAEEALRQSEAGYRALFDNINDLICVHDLAGRLKSVNPAAARYMGFKKEQLESRTIMDLVPHDHRQLVTDNYLRNLREQGSVEGVVKGIKAGGEPIYMDYRSVLVEPEGEEPYATAVGRDITGRIRAQRELRELQARLHQAQKMEAVGTLAGGVAHDFNNILQAIGGYLHLILASGVLDGTIREYVNSIEGAVERASDLVRQLLTFSRKVDPELSLLDLNREVNLSLKIIKRVMPKMIEIKTDLAEDIKPIEADASQIGQILLNLCANARDAMPGGGTLSITTRNITWEQIPSPEQAELTPGDYVLLKVSDTGVGMSEEQIKLVFDPFFTTKPLGKGTGLGLSTVFGVIKAHHGHIRCTSQPNQGSTFEVYLPVADAPAEEVAPPPRPATTPPPGGHESILVVDDEPAIADTVQQVLANQGYQVHTASSGEEALEFFKRHPDGAQLVIMDLGMPGMGGAASLKVLTRDYPAVKVLVASGYAQDDNAETIKEAGAAGFIRKPFDMSQLLRRVRSILDHDQPPGG